VALLGRIKEQALTLIHGVKVLWYKDLRRGSESKMA
jgi:hypothetical protein